MRLHMCMMYIRVSHLSGVRDRAVHVEQTDRTPVHDVRLCAYETDVADLRALCEWCWYQNAHKVTCFATVFRRTDRPAYNGNAVVFDIGIVFSRRRKQNVASDFVRIAKSDERSNSPARQPLSRRRVDREITRHVSRLLVIAGIAINSS